MRALTQRQQYAGQDKPSSLPSRGPAQHVPSESVVVVLGVMYPSVLPPLVDAGVRLDLAFPTPCLDTGRKTVAVIFYDPLSSKGNGDEAPLGPKERKKYKIAAYGNRAEAQKAIARDLALLSSRKRG